MLSLADPVSQQRFNRTFFILFGILFLIAPLYYQDNPGGEGLFLPFNNVVWIAAIFLIGLGLLKFGYSGQLRLPKMSAAILFFLTVTTLVGAIGTVSTPTSWMFRSLSIWGGMLLFFSLAQFQLTRRQRDNLLYLLLASTTLQALYAFTHLLAIENPQGWISYLAISDLPSWMSKSRGIPRAIFQQQNLAASYTATGLLIGIFLTTLPSYRNRSLLLKTMVLGAISICALVTIATGSRVGLLAGAAGTLLIVICRHQQLLRHRGKRLLMLLVVLGISLGLASQIDSKTGGLQKSLDKFSRVSQTSQDPTRNDVRIMMYDSSLELLLEKPLFGYGIGQFQPVWHNKKAQYLAEHPEAAILEPRLSHPHNELLFWAVEGGLIALSGILVLALAFLKVCVGLGWQRGGAYLALLLPITLHTQVELPFYISQLHWLLFIALIALVASHRTKTIQVPISQFGRATLLAACISLPVVSSIFFTHSLISNKLSLIFQFSKQKDLRLLEYPSKNIYFADFSEFLKMQTLLQYALQNHKGTLVQDYANWATERLKQLPDAGLFAGLGMALHYLDKREQSKQVLQRGLSIYPTSRVILAAEKRLQKIDASKAAASENSNRH